VLYHQRWPVAFYFVMDADTFVIRERHAPASYSGKPPPWSYPADCEARALCRVVQTLGAIIDEPRLTRGKGVPCHIPRTCQIGGVWSTSYFWRIHHVAAVAIVTRLLCQTCPATAAITIIPPVKLAMDGAPLKEADRTHATASGVLNPLISAFSMAETLLLGLVAGDAVSDEVQNALAPVLDQEHESQAELRCAE
jgi:hypothetical protein